MDWWTGGLVDWWTGGLVDRWTGGLMDPHFALARLMAPEGPADDGKRKRPFLSILRKLE